MSPSPDPGHAPWPICIYVYPSHENRFLWTESRNFFITSCSWEIDCSQNFFQKVILKAKQNSIHTYTDAKYQLSDLVFDYLITARRFLWEEGHSILILGLLPQWRSHWYVFGWQIGDYAPIATSMPINRGFPYAGPKGFALSSYGLGVSTVEPFLILEKKITAKHVVFWVEKRLAAQGIIPVWKE